ncbi:glycosyltransferase family 4 protein [Methylotetracoccus oryzae]|uniref:glycosyltransferase family 4 protein n=1 Tax=Methylotetracoccus oryzae TaxID=1919059 RepID=UPI0011193392|nr:glycosyltransferase family 1 protein [Methylotetracoccus oryzae]
MKLALISDAWRPQVNGVVTTLTKTCGTLERLGHQVEAFTPDRFWNVPCPTYPEIRLALGCGRQLARWLDAMQPDAIHIATEGPLGMAARRYCLRRKLPYTTSFHTRFAEYANLRFKFPLAWGYALLRWFHSGSTRVMVATPTLRDELAGRGFRNLVLWSRGVDASLFKPGDKHLLPDPRPIFLYGGRVAVEKSIEDFLSLDLPGTKVIVGDGPDREMLEERYPAARFVGCKYGEELAAHFAAADAFVFPSRTDTFGLVLLEALACGVPVAAYPVPGPNDVITDPAVGCLNEDLKEAAMTALTLDPAACRRYAQGYSWENCAAQFQGNLAPIGGRSAIPSPGVAG